MEPAQSEAMTAPEAAGDEPEIRIAYAGAIIAAETFALCICALESVRARLGRPLFLEFFGGHAFSDEPWFNSEWMHVNGTLDEARLNPSLRHRRVDHLPAAMHQDRSHSDGGHEDDIGEERFHRCRLFQRAAAQLDDDVTVSKLADPREGFEEHIGLAHGLIKVL